MNRNTPRISITAQIIILVAVLAVIGGGIYLWLESRPTSTSKFVTFRVEGPGGYAKVNWKVGKQNLLENKTITTPWEQTMTIAQGTQVILTAANPTSIGGVTCTIKLNRVAWKTSTIDKPNRGIACGGIVP